MRGLRALSGRPDALWTARPRRVEDFSQFEVLEGGQSRGTVHWGLIGAHNMENALAAIAAAAMPVSRSSTPSRRWIRSRASPGACSCAAKSMACAFTTISRTIRPRSRRRSMACAGASASADHRRAGAPLQYHENGRPSEHAGPSLLGADEVWFTRRRTWVGTWVPSSPRWAGAGTPVGDIDELATALAQVARPGDHVLIMSNGGFGGLHGKLLAATGRKSPG